MYKKDILTKNDIKFTETPGASYQDTAFNMKVWCSVKRAWFCREAFVYYRQDNQNSSVNNKEKVYNVCMEYEEALKFARAKNKKLVPYIQKMRYSAYLWNYDRIADKYKEEFCERMRSDLRQVLHEGEFLHEIYGPKERLKINLILNLPSVFRLKKRLSRPCR